MFVYTNYTGIMPYSVELGFPLYGSVWMVLKCTYMHTSSIHRAVSSSFACLTEVNAVLHLSRITSFCVTCYYLSVKSSRFITFCFAALTPFYCNSTWNNANFSLCIECDFVRFKKLLKAFPEPVKSLFCCRKNIATYKLLEWKP